MNISSGKMLCWVSVFAVLGAVEAGAAVEVVPWIDGGIYTAAYSPDGRYAVSGGTDKAVKIWDVKNGRLSRILYGHESIVSGASWSPDGRRVVSASGDNTVKIWDAQTGREELTLGGHTNWVWQACFSPDGRRIASASADRTVRVWDADSGTEIFSIPAHSAAVRCVLWSPDGRRIASASSDGTIKLWNAADGAEIRSFEGRQGTVWALAYSPDSGLIASGADDGVVKVWDAETGLLVRDLKQDGGAVYALAYSRDGKRLAAGYVDGVVRTWDADSFYAGRSFGGHKAAVYALDFSPDGRELMSGSFDTFLKIWRIQDGAALLSLGGGSLTVKSASWSPDGARLVSGGGGGLVTVWDAERGRLLLTLTGHSGEVRGTAYNRDGSRILTAGADKTIRIWDAGTGRELEILRGHTEAVNAAVFSPDGARIASAAGETLKIWDIEAGRTLYTFTHPGGVKCAAYSPDGRFVVSGGGGKDGAGFLMVWNARTKMPPFMLEGHRAAVLSASFSGDGRRIISASADETVKIWNAETGKEIIAFRGHSNGVLSAAFSPDGSRALSGDENFIVKEWDTRTGRVLRDLGQLSGEVYTVSYSPDGGRLFAGSAGGDLRFWDAASGAETAMFSRYADGEWVCVNPLGFYDSSPYGAENILLRIDGAEGVRLYNLERFRSLLYRGAGKGAGGLAPDSEDGGVYGALIDGAAELLPPDIAINSPRNGSDIKEATARLVFSTAYENEPVSRIRVLLNGRLIASNDNGAFSSSRQLSREAREITIDNNGKYHEYDFPVALNAGGNFIEAYASNRYAEARDSVEVLWNNAPSSVRRQLPDLWIFSIGVGVYNDPDIPNLDWTPFDARDIIGTFKRQQGKLYRKVNSVIIADKMAILPTQKNIMPRLGYFKQLSPNDTALVFIAGRGFTDAAGKFYLLPKDAAYKKDGTIDTSKAIPQDKLFSMLDLPCKKIILLDLYNAEGKGGRENLYVDYNGLVRDLQQGGAVVISSCSGIENAQVISKNKHGVFAYAVMQGLKGGADSTKDGVIGIGELKTYLNAEIPKLTSSMQHPITSVPESFLFFNAARLR